MFHLPDQFSIPSQEIASLYGEQSREAFGQVGDHNVLPFVTASQDDLDHPYDLARLLLSLSTQELGAGLRIAPVVVTGENDGTTIHVAESMGAALVTEPPSGGHLGALLTGMRSAFEHHDEILYSDDDCVAPKHWAHNMFRAAAVDASTQTTGTLVCGPIRSHDEGDQQLKNLVRTKIADGRDRHAKSKGSVTPRPNMAIATGSDDIKNDLVSLAETLQPKPGEIVRSDVEICRFMTQNTCRLIMNLDEDVRMVTRGDRYTSTPNILYHALRRAIRPDDAASYRRKGRGFVT